MGDMLQNFPTEEVEIYDKDGNKVIKARGLFGKTGLTVTDTSVPYPNSSPRTDMIFFAYE